MKSNVYALRAIDREIKKISLEIAVIVAILVGSWYSMNSFTTTKSATIAEYYSNYNQIVSMNEEG